MASSIQQFVRLRAWRRRAAERQQQLQQRRRRQPNPGAEFDEEGGAAEEGYLKESGGEEDDAVQNDNDVEYHIPSWGMLQAQREEREGINAAPVVVDDYVRPEKSKK
jgi:hypothetical protein